MPAGHAGRPVLLVLRGGELGDFGPCRRDEFVVGMRVAMQAPTTVRCLGEEHPRPVGNARVACGFGDEPGEFGYHRELLVPVESAGVGDYLHTDVRVVAVHVGQHAGRDLVYESCGVLPKHWDVWDLLDAHDGYGDCLGECVRIGEGALGRGDVDHRHGTPPSVVVGPRRAGVTTIPP